MDWGELVEDLTATMRDVFGDPVLYYIDPDENPDVDPVEIFAPFDTDHVALRRGDGIETTSAVTMIDVRIADLGLEPTTRDEVEVRGKRYRVSALHPSSSDMWKLHLRLKR